MAFKEEEVETAIKKLPSQMQDAIRTQFKDMSTLAPRVGEYVKEKNIPMPKALVEAVKEKNRELGNQMEAHYMRQAAAVETKRITGGTKPKAVGALDLGTGAPIPVNRQDTAGAQLNKLDKAGWDALRQGKSFLVANMVENIGDVKVKVTMALAPCDDIKKTADGHYVAVVKDPSAKSGFKVTMDISASVAAMGESGSVSSFTIVKEPPVDCVTAVNKVLTKAGANPVNANTGHTVVDAIESKQFSFTSMADLKDAKKNIDADKFSKFISATNTGDVACFVQKLSKTKAAEYEKTTGDKTFEIKGEIYAVHHVALVSEKNFWQSRINSGNVGESNSTAYMQTNRNFYDGLVILPMEFLTKKSTTVATNP